MDHNSNFSHDQDAIIEEEKQEITLPQNEVKEKFSLEDLPDNDFLGILSYNIQS